MQEIKSDECSFDCYGMIYLNIGMMLLILIMMKQMKLFLLIDFQSQIILYHKNCLLLIEQ